MEDRDLTLAVVRYLAKGSSAFPRRDADAALAMPIAQPAELLERARAVVDECMSVPVDWSNRTLEEGGREAEREIAKKHPELGPDALAALFWAFTYLWR